MSSTPRDLRIQREPSASRRRPHRVRAVAAVIALGVLIAACEAGPPPRLDETGPVSTDRASYFVTGVTSVGGEARPNVAVEVVGGIGVSRTVSDATGAFAVEVPLHLGEVNELEVRHRFTDIWTSTSASLSVEQTDPTGDAEVSGVVRDALTDLPLPDATVRVGASTTTSAADGGFLLEGLPEGEVVVQVEAAGYVTGVEAAYATSAIDSGGTEFGMNADVSLHAEGPVSSVGPEGGTIVTPGGFEFVVPAGSLDHPTDIIITEVSGAIGDGLFGAIPTVDIGPSGLLFDPAATLRVPLGPTGASPGSVVSVSILDQTTLQLRSAVGSVSSDTQFVEIPVSASNGDEVSIEPTMGAIQSDPAEESSLPVPDASLPANCDEGYTKQLTIEFVDDLWSFEPDVAASLDIDATDFKEYIPENKWRRKEQIFVPAGKIVQVEFHVTWQTNHQDVWVPFNGDPYGFHVGVLNWRELLDVETTLTLIDNLDCETETAGGSGDPHYRTFDGLAYDFQGYGEYLIFELPGDPGITVQSRQVPLAGAQNVTVSSQVAVEISGTRVTFDRDRDEPVYLDGTPLPIEDPGVPYPLPNDIDVVRSSIVTSRGVRGTRYELTWDSTERSIAVDVFGRSLAVSVTLLRSDEPSGLLGDLDADRSDDLALRDDTVLPQPVSPSDLYQVFGESWRISQGESLFDYEVGETTDTFTDTSFPGGFVTVADLEPQAREDALAACVASGVTIEPLLTNCILDYALSQDDEFLDVAEQGGVDLMGDCAVRLDGVNDQIRIGHEFESSEFTFEAWVHPQSLTENSFTTGGGLATYGTGDTAAWATWLLAPSPSLPPEEAGLHAQLNYGLAGPQTGTPTDPIPFNQWTHVAVTYDGGDRNLYVDGQLVDSLAWDTPIAAGGGRVMVLGNNFPGANEYFGGEMDEVRVWSVARSDEEIAANFDRKVDPLSSGLQMYLDFDNCGGQTTPDLTANGRDGVLGSTTGTESTDPSYVAGSAPFVD